MFTNISEDTLTITGDIVLRAYEKVGIKRNADGLFPSFQGMDYEQMPTFSTFNECLLERINEIRKDTSQRKELDLLMDLSISGMILKSSNGSPTGLGGSQNRTDWLSLSGIITIRQICHKRSL